jgi:hypothetical protein
MRPNFQRERNEFKRCNYASETDPNPNEQLGIHIGAGALLTRPLAQRGEPIRCLS